LRCKAVVEGNVESFTSDGTWQRKTHNAFASLCVSDKAISTASFETLREAFFLCSIAERQNYRHTTFLFRVEAAVSGMVGAERMSYG